MQFARRNASIKILRQLQLKAIQGSKNEEEEQNEKEILPKKALDAHQHCSFCR